MLIANCSEDVSVAYRKYLVPMIELSLSHITSNCQNFFTCSTLFYNTISFTALPSVCVRFRLGNIVSSMLSSSRDSFICSFSFIYQKMKIIMIFKSKFIIYYECEWVSEWVFVSPGLFVCLNLSLYLWQRRKRWYYSLFVYKSIIHT